MLIKDGAEAIVLVSELAMAFAIDPSSFEDVVDRPGGSSRSR